MGLIIYLVFYFSYGNILEKKVVKASSKNITPAVRLRDGIDYVPTNKFVLFGHHFASIAGAGPIVGPAIAMVWGWLPGILWVWIGNIFIGAVHDYLSLMSSVRYDGKSVQWISGKLMGKITGYIFTWFVFLAILLVIAAFASILAGLLAKNPMVASATVFFIIVAIIMGIFLYRVKLGFIISTVVGLILMGLSIYGAHFVPIHLGEKAWLILLIIYTIVASSLPVWILLQPRDYLNAWILWIGLIIGGLGLLLAFKHFEMPLFTEFSAHAIGGKPSPFWPTVPLIIACGALSGFHSLVSSGTTSKQLDDEKNGLFIGYGAMFTEGFLATVVIASIAAFGFSVMGRLSNVSHDYVRAIKALGGPGGIFSKAFALSVNKGLGLPVKTMQIFASLWLSAFVLTTLDTTNRIGKFLWIEIMDPIKKKVKVLYKIFANRYIASIIPAILGLSLALGGTWNIIWPAFSGTNQMLASIALITSAVWVIKVLKPSKALRMLILVPAIVLWITVTAALIWFLFVPTPAYFSREPAKSIVIGIIVGIMIILNIYLLISFFKTLKHER